MAIADIFEAVEVPAGVSEVVVTCKRATAADPTVFADPGSHIGVYVFWSPDGVAWEFLTGYTTTGGRYEVDGVEEVENVHQLWLDDEHPLRSHAGWLKVSAVTILGPEPKLVLDLIAR